MKKMAFVSRHTPTADQIALAKGKGYELIHVGDMDAFNPDYSVLNKAAVVEDSSATWHGLKYQAVAVVHPWIALCLAQMGWTVAVFENGNRAAEGEKPQFFAKALHIMEQPF